MNYHLLFYRTGQRIREYQKHLRTRRAYCLLATVTYTNTLLFALMMFRQYELLVDILFCISSVLIGVSVTGLYLSTPFIMVPDVVFKVILATCAFFFAVKEADEGNEGSGVRLALVMTGYGLQFYENYFLFNAIVHLYRTKELARPPPDYNCFAITAPKMEEGKMNEKVHQSAAADAPCSSESNHDWSTTPPPSYAMALARMARQIAFVPNPASTPTSSSTTPPASRTSDDRRFEILMHSMSLP